MKLLNLNKFSLIYVMMYEYSANVVLWIHCDCLNEKQNIRKPLNIQWWNFILPFEIPLLNKQHPFHSFKWRILCYQIKKKKKTRTNDSINSLLKYLRVHKFIYEELVGLILFYMCFLFSFLKSISTCCLEFNNTLNSSFLGGLFHLCSILWNASSPCKRSFTSLYWILYIEVVTYLCK